MIQPLARVAGLVLLALPGTAWAEAACAPDRLDLRWDGGRESFAVEVADDAEERAQGLMFRSAMSPASGMLFVYDGPRRVQFWMKNTLIPLDMLFVDDAGCVVKVHEQARPHSLDAIESGQPVVLVVELQGGAAHSLGIAAGDRVARPSAGWPRASHPCRTPR